MAKKEKFGFGRLVSRSNLKSLISWFSATEIISVGVCNGLYGMIILTADIFRLILKNESRRLKQGQIKITKTSIKYQKEIHIAEF